MKIIHFYNPLKIVIWSDYKKLINPTLKKFLYLFLLAFILFFSNNLGYSQSFSSAPHSNIDIFHSGSSLWTIGETKQHGKGVYKYQSRRWTYYGAPGARKICASRYDKPAILNDFNHLQLYSNRRWEKIGENISAISSSYNNSQIWAVVNGHLRYYNNNSWYNTSATPKFLKDISVAKNGDVYALNNSNYLFKLFSTSWNTTGSLRGISISAAANSSVYLCTPMINMKTPNVKKYHFGQWKNISLNAKKVVSNSSNDLFYLDGLGRIYSIRFNDTTKISSNPISSISNTSNYNYNPDVNFIDSLTGETSLFKAIRNNDIMGLYDIVSNGANINKKNKQNKTPLLLAISLGNSTISTTLIRLNPDLEHFDNMSKNALSYAVNKRDTSLVKELLANGANPSSKDFFSDIINYRNSDLKKTRLIALFLNNGINPKTYQIEKIIKLNHEENYFQLVDRNPNISLRKTDYNNFLKEAVANRNKNIAKHCIENGANPDPLIPLALTTKDNELIMFCLEKGAKPNPVIDYAIKNNDEALMWISIDKYNGTKDYALIKSCEYKKLNYAESLLKVGANANQPLLNCIRAKDIECVNLLLQYNADGSITQNFIAAIETKYDDMVSILLANGANHNDGILKAIEVQSISILKLLVPRAEKLNSELIKAASKRDKIEIVSYLIEMGSNPQDGLESAVKADKIDNTKILIENGAEINSNDLVITAINNNSIDMVKLLIANGADVNAGLEIAINNNRSTIVSFLIQKGANTKNSNTYYVTAVTKNYIETLKVLISNQLDLSFKAQEKNTLIHLSCKKNFYNITKVLLETNKIDINAYNDDGMTALMYVVKKKSKSIKFCQLMVEYGADVNARDPYGTVVRKMAKGIKVKNYLRKNGALKK